MPAVFSLPDNRRSLVFRLMKEGFKVRMHGYEYFIRKGKFICMLILYPYWSSAVIYRVEWNLKEFNEAIDRITRILREIDSELKIEVSS